jgi:hypothetical protein
MSLSDARHVKPPHNYGVSVVPAAALVAGFSMEGHMAEIRDLDIDQIKIDREIQPREVLDDERIKLFQELYLDKDTESEPPPPLTVFHDAADSFWLSDGYHRYHAALAALSEGGPSMLPVEIHEGDRRDAFLYAVGVNGKHGKELTRQEKRNAVCRILRDSEWSKWSVRKIARHTGTSIGLVSNVRSELESQNATVHDEQCASSRTVEYERAGKKQTMKRGDGGRARKNKAKNDTTTTVPASPAVPQDEPPTDQDEEPQINDTEEVVDSETPPDTDNLPAESGAGATPQAVTTDEFDELAQAWRAAAVPERREFLTWVCKLRVTELGLDSPTESNQLIGDMLIEIHKPSDLA